MKGTLNKDLKKLEIMKVPEKKITRKEQLRLAKIEKERIAAEEAARGEVKEEKELVKIKFKDG